MRHASPDVYLSIYLGAMEYLYVVLASHNKGEEQTKWMQSHVKAEVKLRRLPLESFFSSWLDTVQEAKPSKRAGKGPFLSVVLSVSHDAFLPRSCFYTLHLLSRGLPCRARTNGGRREGKRGALKIITSASLYRHKGKQV